MYSPFGPPSLETVDAALARWRIRLAAASRNVSELSELPAFAAVKAAAPGTGRLAAEARGLVATMDELWQGVLLIGATLDRAEQARRTGSRLWRGDEAAAEASAILHGPSVQVDLAETPVLHRTLLAGPRAAATVSPETLLHTMQAAFDTARAQLARIEAATTRAATLRAELSAAAAALPSAIAARLDATAHADPLDQLDALESLRPAVTEAQALQGSLAAAAAALDTLRTQAAQADTDAATCQAATTALLPLIDATAAAELPPWLDRLRQTFAKGNIDATRIGLANWQAAHTHAASQAAARAAAARAALARRDDLRARLAALAAKARTRNTPALHTPALHTPALHTLEATATTALATTPTDLEAAAAALRAFQAALATT